ncbi:hypothetical protein BsWGS_00953 [Bradybaena similaris]
MVSVLVLHQWHFPLDLTMKVYGMSNQTKSSPEHKYWSRETDVSVLPVSDNDVDDLKGRIKGTAARPHDCEASEVALNNDVARISSTVQLVKKSGDNFSLCAEKLKELSHDDTDAAMSVSSDTTLEPESSDVQLKSHEDKMSSLSSEKYDHNNGSSRSYTSSVSDNMAQTETSSYVRVMPSGVFTDDLAVDVGTSARFSKVLENISLPLLYIPTTKQLVAGSLDGSVDGPNPRESAGTLRDLSILYMPERDYSYNGSESASSTLDLSSSELLSPHSPMPKAHSTQEFHYMGRYTDSDRLTVHSTDSCPGYHNSFEPGSHVFADNSSLSSVSTGTDFSVSAVSISETDLNVESKSLSCDAPDEAGFVDISLHSRNSFDRGYNSSSLDSGYGDKRAPSFQAARKKSFPGLKNLFTKKAKEESPLGWKLFGRVPPKALPDKNVPEITLDVQSRQQKPEKPVFSSTSKKQQGLEVMSTTALILESRPTNLPSKTPEEVEKHRQQYEEMVEAAKRKELKDLKLKKKHLQQQRKLEDQMMAAARVWDSEILPSWESMKGAKKTRDLWWMGLPPNVRGRVWQLAIGNDLNITHALYDICHERAEERIRFVEEEGGSGGTGPGHPAAAEGVGGQQVEPSNKESSVQVIKLDVSRTFPQLCIFQKGGPFYDLLHNLLGAYACYRPDVGYVQGMSFIAAILLLNMDVADAFVCFANLLNRPCQLAFFRMDEHLMTAYYRTFEEFLKESLPRLHAHFISLSVTPNLYLMEWVFLIYSKSLPLDVACRVWDVYFRDGEEFLFRTALAILKIHESILVKMDFIHAAQFLTKLPEDVSADQLFKEIETIKMNIDKRGFHSVHSLFKDLHSGNS